MEHKRWIKDGETGFVCEKTGWVLNSPACQQCDSFNGIIQSVFIKCGPNPMSKTEKMPEKKPFPMGELEAVIMDLREYAKDLPSEGGIINNYHSDLDSIISCFKRQSTRQAEKIKELENCNKILGEQWKKKLTEITVLEEELSKERYVSKSRFQDIHKLEEENEKLRKDATEFLIDELVIKDGTMEMIAKTRFSQVFAEYVRSMMKSSNAENFQSFRMEFGDSERFYIVAGKADGKSIQEVYAEKCEQIKKLEEKNNS